MQDFRKLKVWERSHRLSLQVYELTRGFPKEELFGLTSQLRRAAVSVELNLAEGCGRGSDVDFNRFVVMAIGSASEVECLLLIARDLRLISGPASNGVLAESLAIKRMLIALSQKLKAKGS